MRLRLLPFDGALAGEAAAQRMGGPVLGSPPAAIMSSEWRGLQVRLPCCCCAVAVAAVVMQGFGCVAGSTGQAGAERTSRAACRLPPTSALQASALDAAADAMFDPVAYIDNPESDTQASV